MRQQARFLEKAASSFELEASHRSQCGVKGACFYAPGVQESLRLSERIGTIKKDTPENSIFFTRAERVKAH